MPAPEGYTELDLVGFTDKGNYSAETTYVKNDLVHSSNKIYKSLQDNNTGQALPAAPETATAYWEVWLSGGVDSAESLTAKDTDNLTGGGAGQVIIAQELLDAITAKVIKQLSSSDIVQTESTATNKVPSAAYLKEIKDGLDNDISELTSSSTWTPKIYDLDTYKYDLPSQKYWRVGPIYILSIEIVNDTGIDLSDISTMLQIRNFPCTKILGGAVYISTMASRVIQIQASNIGVYFRPNITKTDNSKTGIITLFLLGI